MLEQTCRNSSLICCRMCAVSGCHFDPNHALLARTYTQASTTWNQLFSKSLCPIPCRLSCQFDDLRQVRSTMWSAEKVHGMNPLGGSLICRVTCGQQIRLVQSVLSVNSWDPSVFVTDLLDY